MEKIESVSIIFPCLNEEITLGKCILDAKSVLEHSGIQFEIIVADNGSTDSSIEIAKRLGAKVVEVSTKGYGSAIRAGINESSNQVIFMLDSDGSYPLDNFASFISEIEQGSDLVIGNRFEGGIEKNAMPFLHKYFGNPALSFLGRKFYRIKVRDFHCGLRAFTRDSVNQIKLNSTGMEFASELIIKYSLGGFRISETPTRLVKDGRNRPPHLNTWPDGWRHLKFLMAFAPKSILMVPGFLLTTLGLILNGIILVNVNGYTERIFSFQTVLFNFALISVGVNLLCLNWIVSTFASIVRVQFKSKLAELDMRKITRRAEAGLLVGILQISAGLIGMVFALVRWWENSFGALEVIGSLRITVPSVTILLLGMQILASSLVVLAIITLDQHRDVAHD